MEIPIKLQMLINSILDEYHSYDEWLELEQETKCYLKGLPAELRSVFAESGADETLYMVCAGIRAMR